MDHKRTTVCGLQSKLFFLYQISPALCVAAYIWTMCHDGSLHQPPLPSKCHFNALHLSCPSSFLPFNFLSEAPVALPLAL